MEVDSKKSVKDGLIAAFLGSLCCTAPLALVLLGLSGVSGAMALVGKLRSWFQWTLLVPVAAVFLGGSIYVHIKSREGECNWDMIKKHRNHIIVTVAFAAIVWAAILYFLVPAAFNALG